MSDRWHVTLPDPGRTITLSIDLTGATGEGLDPGWRSVEVVCFWPVDRSASEIREMAANFYGVRMEQVVQKMR